MDPEFSKLVYDAENYVIYELRTRNRRLRVLAPNTLSILPVSNVSPPPYR